MNTALDVSVIGVEGPGPPPIELVVSDNRGKAAENIHTITIPPPKPPRVQTQEALLFSNIEDHFDCSVITSLLCFPPLGLWAVVASRRVKHYLSTGNVHRAMACSKRARLLNNFNLAIGALQWLTVFVVLILYFSGWIGNYYQEPLRPV